MKILYFLSRSSSFYKVSRINKSYTYKSSGLKYYRKQDLDIIKELQTMD